MTNIVYFYCERKREIKYQVLNYIDLETWNSELVRTLIGCFFLYGIEFEASWVISFLFSYHPAFLLIKNLKLLSSVRACVTLECCYITLSMFSSLFSWIKLSKFSNFQNRVTTQKCTWPFTVVSSNTHKTNTWLFYNILIITPISSKS